MTNFSGYCALFCRASARAIVHAISPVVSRAALSTVLFVVPLGVVTVALSACGKQRSAAASPAAALPVVQMRTLRARDIEIVDELSGRLSAAEVSDVRPQVAGIVQKRLFVEGSWVTRGQALYQLDAATYQAAYDTAKGTLAKAEATARAARIKAQRYQSLLEIKGVSEQDTQDYLATAQEAQADVLTDRASLETARINLQRTRIVAPISGKIGKSSVTAGALVTAEQTTALATIQSMDQMYLDVTRSSTDGLRLAKAFASGQLRDADTRVRLILEDGAPYAEAGRLLFSDVTVDATTGSYAMRTVFPNRAHQLLPGMFVRARLSEGVRHDTLLVPQALVTRTAAGQSTLLIVDATNTVRSRAVSADTAYGDQWIVSAGLVAGERIVTEGTQKVTAGTRVRAVEEASTDSTGTGSASGAGGAGGASGTGSASDAAARNADGPASAPTSPSTTTAATATSS